MSDFVEGHSMLMRRPNAKWLLLLHRTAPDGSKRWVWDKELQRPHKNLRDAYDAMGLPPDQAPAEPPSSNATKTQIAEPAGT